MTKIKQFAAPIFTCFLFLILIIGFASLNNQNEDSTTMVVEAQATGEAAEVKSPPAEKQKAAAPGETAASPETAQDPLLILVNSETPLPEDYQITPRLYSDIVVDISIYDSLIKLIDASSKENLSLWVASGYRSVQDQEKILDAAVQENKSKGMSDSESRALASRTIADPLHSEHNTGLAVDFNTVSEDFAATEEYKWLCEHAHEYGFVQRYEAEKADITKIDEEVWHYRYVGKRHAARMKELDMCLEEYCLYLQKQG